jgi:hypothetical protein
MKGTGRPSWRKIVFDNQGVGAIEFAIFLPLLVILIIGIADTARVISARLTLQQAVHRALEKAAVGTVRSDYLYLRGDVAAAAAIPVTNVIVDAWLECNRARQGSFSGACEEGQMVSRYVRVTARTSYKSMFPLSEYSIPSLRSGPDGTVALSATAALRIQ